MNKNYITKKPLGIELQHRLKERGIEVSQQTTQIMISELVQMIDDHLHTGTDVRIKGLGRFTLKQAKARKGRNVHTGEEVNIPSRKVVRFVPSEALKFSTKPRK